MRYDVTKDGETVAKSLDNYAAADLMWKVAEEMRKAGERDASSRVRMVRSARR